MLRSSFKLIGLAAILFATAVPALAEELSNSALYDRCYKQVAQRKAPYNAARTVEVRDGSKDPITACLEVLDKASLVSLGNTRIANVGDGESLAVIDTFHNLHASWFTENQFITSGATGHQTATVAIHDNSQPALYYTRALFDPTTNIDYVVQTTDNLMARRQNQNPTTSANGLAKSQFNLNSNASFRVAPTGLFYGVFEQNVNFWNYSYTASGTPLSGSVIAGQNRGAGVMSSPTYLILNVREPRNFQADGGQSMPRKWAKNVFNDLLCRELPVIRPGDEISFVVPASPIAFRQQAACTRCHASMDRLAAVQRNYKYEYIGGNPGPTIPPYGGVFPDFDTVNQGDGNLWPSSPDALYSRRPPKGIWYFRNYLGELRSIPVNNVADLGLKMTQEDDFYLCAASRYYEYFTQIKVNIGDLQGKELNTVDTAHRDAVIALGLSLKTHKNPRQLVQDILQSNQYKESDFKIIP